MTPPPLVRGIIQERARWLAALAAGALLAAGYVATPPVLTAMADAIGMELAAAILWLASIPAAIGLVAIRPWIEALLLRRCYRQARKRGRWPQTDITVGVSSSCKEHHR